MLLGAVGFGQQRGAAAAQLDLGPAKHAVEHVGAIWSRLALRIAKRPTQRAYLIARHRIPGFEIYRAAADVGRPHRQPGHARQVDGQLPFEIG